MAKPQIDKPVEDLSRRLKLYAEILAAGSKTMKEAALQAGFSKHVANSGAYAWIRKTREDSQYPQLFDYYERLRSERLRQFDITEDSLTKELRTIAFSSIENYLDLPRAEVHKKAQKMREQLKKLYTRLDDYKILGMPEMTDEGPKQTVQYSEEAKPIFKKIEKLIGQIEAVEAGPGYRIRLKFRDEIPDELMPAVAEIRETREGIHVKLHSKLDGIDKLARWLKMYSDTKEGGDVSPSDIKEVTINIKGSQSSMSISPPDTAKSA